MNSWKLFKLFHITDRVKWQGEQISAPLTHTFLTPSRHQSFWLEADGAITIVSLYHTKVKQRKSYIMIGIDHK